MAIEELLAVVAPPKIPIDAGPAERWREVEASLGLTLPVDYRELALHYGSGYFEDPGRLMVYAWNPLDPAYLTELDRACERLRRDRGLPHDRHMPYGVFPAAPGWLPWGNDIDGNLMCWLTEGEPDDWPLILLSAERTSFQQLAMPMTSFLARAFTRQIRTILWDNPAFFSGPEPVRFISES